MRVRSDTLLKIDPELNETAHQGAANALESRRNKKYEQAVEYFRKAHATAPQSQRVRGFLNIAEGVYASTWRTDLEGSMPKVEADRAARMKSYEKVLDDALDEEIEKMFKGNDHSEPAPNP